MAITQRAIGAWAVSNATTQTVTLPTHAAGDMLILRTIRKPFTSPDNTVVNTSGWAQVAAGVANGSTANGVGVGSMGFKAFYKIATSSSETNPVVTWGTTSAPGAAVAASYQKASTEAWVTPAGNGGGDATPRTSQTSTIATHISVTTGDLVDFFRGQCDDSGALTVPTITQTGVTYDTVTESPATALLDGTSNDIAADGGYRTATAGTSSAAAVVTGTSAASEEHGAWMTRLRVNKLIDLGLLDAGPALYAPTVQPDQYMALPSISTGGSGYNAAVVASGPYANWHFGEPSGTTADNAEGTAARDGTLTGGNANPTMGRSGLIAGYDDTAFSFPNLDFPSVSVDGVAAIFDGTKSWSIAAWVDHTPDSNFRYIFDAESADPYRIAFLQSEATTLYLQRTNSAGNDFLTAAPIAAGRHFVVATYDGSNMRLYVDAALTGGPTASTRSVPTGTQAAIGNHRVSLGLPFNGVIDEPAVYNKTLSLSDIDTLYQAGITAIGGVLYAPTVAGVVGAQSITLGLLDAANALYAPTALATNTLSLGLLDAGPAVYAPEVQPDQFLTLGLLDAANALYAPSVTPKNTLALGLLDASSATYAPTVLATNTLTLGLLDAAPALYAPTVAPAAVTLTLGLLDAAGALYAPTLAAGASSLTLGLIDSGPALYAPEVQPDQFLTLALLDAGPTTYAPTLAVGAVGVTLGLLDAGPALYAPTLTTSYAITLGLLDAGPALYAPTVSPDQFVTLGLLDAGPAVYAPTLALGGVLVLPLLDAGPALYAPTLAPQPVGLTLGLLTSTSAVYAPALAKLNTITLGMLDAGAALYAPEVIGAQYLVIPLLDAAGAVYAPAVTTGALVVELPLVASTPDVYAPELVGVAPYLILPLLDAGRALYPPTLEGGVDLSLAELAIVAVSGGGVVTAVTTAGASVVSVATTDVGVTVE